MGGFAFAGYAYLGLRSGSVNRGHDDRALEPCSRLSEATSLDPRDPEQTAACPVGPIGRSLASQALHSREHAWTSQDIGTLRNYSGITSGRLAASKPMALAAQNQPDLLVGRPATAAQKLTCHAPRPRVEELVTAIRGMTIHHNV